MDIVKERYAAAAEAQEPALCCPVDYDTSYLKAIPEEVIERDYGCGDPSRYAREGDVVLDLGSGGGKICFIASQIVGAKGQVIGIDMTPEMLELARRNQPIVAERIGYDNVSFLRGQIQDLRLNFDAVEAFLETHPVSSTEDLMALEEHNLSLRNSRPMIEDQSVDLVVSNCVLNLVHEDLKGQMFREIFRVLKPGGRIAISDIVSKQPTPQRLKEDAALWSGCISGALEITEFVRELENVGFAAVAIDKFDTTAWREVEGISYHSATFTAVRPSDNEQTQTDDSARVLYKGPWRYVEDDNGTIFERGRVVEVSANTLDHLRNDAYGDTMLDFDDTKTSCCS